MQFVANNSWLAGPKTGFCVMLLGIAFFIWGVVMAISTHDLVANGLHAQGFVVDFHTETHMQTTQQGSGRMTSTTTSQQTSYYPIVEFTDAQNNKVRFQDNMGSNRPAYGQGQAVGVIYQAKNPAGTAILDKGYWNFLGPGILAFLGAAFAAAGGFTIVRSLAI